MQFFSMTQYTQHHNFLCYN